MLSPSAGEKCGLGVEQIPYAFHDGFTAEALQPAWQWPADARPTFFLRPGSGELELQAMPASADWSLGAMLGVVPFALDYVAGASLEPADSGAETEAETEAGLAVFADSAHFAAIAVGSGSITLTQTTQGRTTRVAATQILGDGRLYLRTEATGGNRFQFTWSSDGANWHELGPQVTVPTERPVRIAIFAAGPANRRRAFHSFSVESR